jgi:hypothetical protein
LIWELLKWGYVVAVNNTNFFLLFERTIANDKLDWIEACGGLGGGGGGGGGEG